ncbi:hypothetical protein [Leptospira yanagawae]|uniref:hypothetical protein n=1 Tax=Leptospira yanagawae TaxID=293069 RepID=UPI0012ECB10B|nr:hypothetical protein [Leptospira yanagawae]
MNEENEEKFIASVNLLVDSKDKSNKFILSREFNQKIIFPLFTKVLGFCTDIKGGYINKRINLPEQKYSTFTVNDNQLLFRLILGHYQACNQQPTYNPEIIENKNWNEQKIQKYNAKTKNNISLRENYNSHILCIDIDTHELNKHDIYKNNKLVYGEDYYRDLIQFLYEKLGVHPILCQVSKLQRGIYLYYKTDVIRKNEKKELFEIIKNLISEFDEPYHGNKPGRKKTITYKNITGIELRTPNHLNRLPLSYDYKVYDNNYKRINSLVKIFQNVAQNLKTNILLYDATKRAYPKNEDLDVSDEEIKSLLVNAFSEEETEPPKIWNRTKSIKLNSANIKVPIEGGSKNKGLFRLACLFLNSDKADDHQVFYNLVYLNNQSSGDVLFWFDDYATIKYNENIEDKQSDEISWIPTYYGVKALDGILNGAKKYLEANPYEHKTKENEPKKYYNEVVLSSKDKKVCNLIINELKNEFCKKYPYSYLHNVVFEIVSKIRYEENNKREIKKDAKFRKVTKEQLGLGTQFPRNFQDLVKQKYKLKCNHYKMFNLILKSPIFNQIFATKRGYLYGKLGGSCRQFTFNKDRIDLILNLKERITKVIRIEEENREEISPNPQSFILCESTNITIGENRIDIPPLIESS